MSFEANFLTDLCVSLAVEPVYDASDDIPNNVGGTQASAGDNNGVR